MATPPLLAYGHPNSISQPCPYDFLKKFQGQKEGETPAPKFWCVFLLLYVSYLCIIFILGTSWGSTMDPGVGQLFSKAEAVFLLWYPC